MILEMQKLFASLLLSNQNYVNPSQLLNTVVDDDGKKIGYGNQMDINEYLLNLIEMIVTGIDEKKNDVID
jgi:hypothetical protein